MTREGSGATRRGFLALAGSATLAGCGGFGSGFFEDEPPKIEGSALLDAVSGEPPSVSEQSPIAIEQSHLDGMATRARDHLSSVPTPFDSDEIPNGAIRAELTGMHEKATKILDQAPDAESPAESMSQLRDARESARSLAAAWEYIDAGLTPADVRETISEVRDDIETFRGRWRYVGDDPVRAVLAHERIENLVGVANRRIRSATERNGRRPENPITVGEFAGRVESARAALDDAEYLFDRYESSLDEPRGIRDGLEAAGKSLVEILADRRDPLPGGDPDDPDDASSFVDRDIEDAPVASALTDLHRGLDYADNLESERATGLRASVVLSAHETLARVRAFDSLVKQVENDEHVTVESADDVRSIRNDAIQSIEEAVASDANPRLDRRILAEIMFGVEYADDEIRRNDTDDEIPVDWLTRDLGQYVLVGAIAQATPPTSEEVAELIRTTV